jgi:hypothetical protein
VVPPAHTARRRPTAPLLTLRGQPTVTGGRDSNAGGPLTWEDFTPRPVRETILSVREDAIDAALRRAAREAPKEPCRVMRGWRARQRFRLAVAPVGGGPSCRRHPVPSKMSELAAGSARTSAGGCAGGIFEMTSSESGQATFQYGDEIVEGEPRVILRHTVQRGVVPFSRGASQAGRTTCGPVAAGWHCESEASKGQGWRLVARPEP